MRLLARRFKSAAIRLSVACGRWRHSIRRQCCDHHFQRWVSHLHANPPTVLIGSNFAEFGGVRGHIHAIQRFSSLNVELAPSDELLDRLSPSGFGGEYRQAFMDVKPGCIRAIHSHVFPWFITWCYRHRKPGTLWLHTYHLNYYPEHGGGRVLPWQQEINESLINVARHADIRISVSRWQQEYLLEQYGIDTIYIPNGVDVAACDAGDAEGFRARTGLRDFVLYVGRNDPVKNPAEFVRLAQVLPDFQVVMIGNGLSRDVLEKEWGIDVPANCYVLGKLSHADVQDALAACSVLVVTSKREGLPTLVMEGMAHCKPVIVPDEPGCIEAVAGGDCGHIYHLGDIGDLARKTLIARADTETGIRARARVLEEYAWHVIAPRLDALYQGKQLPQPDEAM